MPPSAASASHLNRSAPNALDPTRRRLLRVVVPDDDRPYTDRTVSDLMGKEPEARFKFIMEEAYTAKDIDI